MNKALIGSLVGGLILFIWQFMSWTMLNIHGSEMSYTPQQDQIMECLASSGLEEGSYYMPNIAPGTSKEEQQAAWEEAMGKPWATIHYQSSAENNMGMNMIRGLIIDILAVYMLCYLLMGNNDLTKQKVIVSSILVGLIGYLTISYLNTVWFKTNSMGYLIDAVAQWGVCGVWLGWWLTRGK